jgi:HK97 family phage portal protein
MNIFQRLQLAASYLSTKASRAADAISLNVLGRPVWTGRDYAKFADEGYRRNPVVFMAVNKLATAMAKVPLCVYVDDKEQEKTHPLAMLLRRPNPVTGGAAFFRNHFGFWLLSGNCYLEGNSGKKIAGPNGWQPGETPDDEPTELWTLRPDRVQVVAGRAAMAAGFVYRVNGQIRTWDCNPLNGRGPILHTKFFNPLDDWYGMTPIEAAAYSIDVFNATQEHNKALLDNGARPSGAMVYQPKAGPATLTVDQYERLKNELRESHQGSKNGGKPMLLDGGMTWEQMGLTPAELNFIEGKAMSAREVVMCFGVPPQLLGIPGDNTYSNGKEARQSFYEDTVLPSLDLWLDDFNAWAGPMFGGAEVRPDIDQIDALAPRRSERWTQVSAAPFLTLNEKRTALDYEPWTNETVEGPADELYIPAGQLPLSSDGAGAGDLSAGAGDGAGAAGGSGAEGAPPAPIGDGNAAPADAVQAAALNGTQITSMQAIVQAVADGTLPGDAARAMLSVAYPSAEPTQLEAMVAAAEKYAKENPKPSPAEVAAQMAAAGGAPAPGGKPPAGAKPGAPVPPKPPATRAAAVAGAKSQLEAFGFEAEEANALAIEMGALAYGADA